MIYDAIVAGTGFEGRAQIIRSSVKPGSELRLIREPENPHDPSAIGVYIEVRRFFFRKTWVKIGYIKRNRAAFLAGKVDGGGKIIRAGVKSLFSEQDHPRVSIWVETDW